MERRRSCIVALLLPALVLSVNGCSRDLPTSSPVDAHSQRDRTGSQVTAEAVIVLFPEAIGSVRHLPELGILEGAPVDGDLQSSYFRTTDTNREFRRGFAEFDVPSFPDGIQGAKLVLRESRAIVSASVPSDRHELSSYDDVDLVVSPSDFDRSTSAVAPFETDANLEPQTFDFDVSSLVPSQGGRIGFRVKMDGDPIHAGFTPMGTAFSGSSTPAGVTLEVVTTTTAAVGHLLNVMNKMDLPPGVKASLLAPIQQVEAILEDDNPSNDAAACGQLGAFLAEVDAKEENEQLSAPQASELRQLAQGLQTGLGCGDPSP